MLQKFNMFQIITNTLDGIFQFYEWLSVNIKREFLLIALLCIFRRIINVKYIDRYVNIDKNSLINMI